MDRHFHCTACGKCCYGQLPLSLKDAVANIDRFPLAIMWTTVRPGAKSFEITARLGTTVTLGKRKKVAVQITPISYIPPALSCPELAADGRCAIHAQKPSRCRTMPFYPYRDEADQGDLLVPRPGWLCETDAQKPVVYRDKKIVGRGDFDLERKDLVEQAPILRAYAERLMANAPNVKAAIEAAAKKPRGGTALLNFSAIVSRLDGLDLTTFAKMQHPVLTQFAAKTEALPDAKDHHRYYQGTAAAMERILARG